MRRWPNSLPDYDWPKELLGRRTVVRRVMLAALFRLTYLLGLIVGFFDRSRNRVLVIRTDGMGDALLFEPALDSLCRAMSPRRVHLWAPQLSCDLLRFHPRIHRLMVIPRGYKAGNLAYFNSGKLRMKFGYALGRWTFDKVIYPVESPEPFGNWLLVSARAHERWLNPGDTINQFDWQRQRTHEQATRILYRPTRGAHELTHNEDLARQWTRERSLRKPRVHFSEQVEALATAQISEWRAHAQLLGCSEIVGVIPTASLAINAYPYWATVLMQLWELRRIVPVLIGGPDDQKAIDQLADVLDKSHIPHLQLPAPLGILEMAAIVGELDGVLSVDTGLAHLAVAQHVPTVVLVGGGYPGRFFPWPKSPRHTTLTKSVPCAGCNNRCSQTEAICITQIAPGQIVEAYEKLKRRKVTVTINPQILPLRAVG